MKSIIPLRPHVSNKVWGGSRLAKIQNITVDKDEDPIGETWEVSAHHDGPSSSEFGLLNTFATLTDIPYLVKFIDTAKNLSVQVHPQDDYAERVEKAKGKSECWLILDAKPGAGIFLGMKKGVTKKAFEKAIIEKEDISEYLMFYPVMKGDFFYVPAGTIHAIGEGVFLAEVQQCSDVTYRVWDWNRVDSNGKSRELHVKKSMDVICFNDEFNHPVNFKIQNKIFSYDLNLLEISDFNLFSYSKNEDFEMEVEFGERYASVILLEGELLVERNLLSHKMKKYQAVLLPVEKINKFKVSGKGIFLIIK